MGLSNSKKDKEQKKDQNITKTLQKQRSEDKHKIKLLFLGAGESGKSTILKQFQILYKTGFTEEERKSYRVNVYKNTISNMQLLLTGLEGLGLTLPEALEAARDRVMDIDPTKDVSMTPELAKDVSALWDCDECREGYVQRSKLQLEDSAKYWFENVESMAGNDFIPSTNDILRCRIKTIGIVESDFEVERLPFSVYDVGGQKNERRKWIHCFEGVTAVIFVVALNEYDRMMREDTTKNRMHDAVELFQNTMNKYLVDPAVFLFFNKNDLFEEKLQTTDLNVCWPEYTGGKDKEKALQFVTEKFLEGIENRQSREIFVRVTQATDTDNIKYVFDGVKNVMLKRRLESVGF